MSAKRILTFTHNLFHRIKEFKIIQFFFGSPCSMFPWFGENSLYFFVLPVQFASYYWRIYFRKYFYSNIYIYLPTYYCHISNIIRYFFPWITNINKQNYHNYLDAQHAPCWRDWDPSNGVLPVVIFCILRLFAKLYLTICLHNYNIQLKFTTMDCLWLENIK